MTLIRVYMQTFATIIPISHQTLVLLLKNQSQLYNPFKLNNNSSHREEKYAPQK